MGLGWPLTKKEARSRQYNHGYAIGGRSDYDEERCAATVSRDWNSYQCKRKNGHGPEGLYCKQHAPEAQGVYDTKHKVEGEIWYMVELGYTNRLSMVRVSSETEKRVYVTRASSWGAGWQDKESHDRRYYKDVQEAMDFMREALAGKIKRLQGQIDSLRADLKKGEADFRAMFTAERFRDAKR